MSICSSASPAFGSTTKPAKPSFSIAMTSAPTFGSDTTGAPQTFGAPATTSSLSSTCTFGELAKTASKFSFLQIQHYCGYEGQNYGGYGG